MIPVNTPVRVRTEKGIPVEYRGHSGVVESHADKYPAHPIIVRFASGEACGFAAHELEAL